MVETDGEPPGNSQDHDVGLPAVLLSKNWTVVPAQNTDCAVLKLASGAQGKTAPAPIPVTD